MAIEWESLDATDLRIPGKSCNFSMPVSTYRAKVPYGWLVMITLCGHPTLTFYPDPLHEWSGATAEIERLHSAVAAAVGAPDGAARSPFRRQEPAEGDRAREPLQAA